MENISTSQRSSEWPQTLRRDLITENSNYKSERIKNLFFSLNVSIPLVVSYVINSAPGKEQVISAR